jgi:hypothetical protein
VPVWPQVRTTTIRIFSSCCMLCIYSNGPCLLDGWRWQHAACTA